MTTLKQALNNPEKLEEFIKEHEQDEQGNEEIFNSLLSSMALQKKKSVHRTSSEELDENCNDIQTR